MLMGIFKRKSKTKATDTPTPEAATEAPAAGGEDKPTIETLTVSQARELIGPGLELGCANSFESGAGEEGAPEELSSLVGGNADQVGMASAVSKVDVAAVAGVDELVGGVCNGELVAVPVSGGDDATGGLVGTAVPAVRVRDLL